MSSLRYSDIGSLRRRGYTRPHTDDSFSHRSHHRNYQGLLSEMKRYRNQLRQTLANNADTSHLKGQLSEACNKLQSHKQELRSHLDESLNQLDEYKYLKAELSLQCTELERENFELKKDNGILETNNHTLRDILADYMEETDRFERVLNKVYTESAKIDKELTERVRKALERK